MRYIIDGYNLLFKRFHCIENFSQDRSKLIEELVELARTFHMDVCIVFDAHYHIDSEHLSHKDSVGILYTDFGQTADDCIVRMVGRDTHPKNICVITSDNRLALRCRRNLAQTMQVPEFLQMLVEKKRKSALTKNRQEEAQKRTQPSTPLEDPEMARWLKIFTERSLDKEDFGA